MQESINLTYVVYPKETPSENATLVIRTVNNGLTISSNVEGSRDTFTVTNGGQISYRRQGIERESDSAEYSLSRVFKGHNISYGIQCLDMPDSDCKGVAATNQQFFTHQTDIEVLSNKIPLKGFFIIEPYMIFL